MKLLPAIDLLGGRAVRLEAGRRDRATVFHEHPVALVHEFAEQGARGLHVVDLDAAFGGASQRELIAEIIGKSSIPVQLGGGIRDRDMIAELIELGAARIVLGSAAVRTPALVQRACEDYPSRIVVAVDARDGVVAVDGWTQSGEVTALELGRRAASWGAGALLYTDIARDGLRTGPNVAATVALQAAVGCDVIASGGVGELADLVALRDAGVRAVVVGRALYDRRFSIADALRITDARA